MKLRLARKIGKAVGTRCLNEDMSSICPHGWPTHRRSMKRLARSIASSRRRGLRAIDAHIARRGACEYVDKSGDKS